MTINRDAGTIKRQRGANAHHAKGTSIDPGEDINLQYLIRSHSLITPHDFAQNTTRAVYFEKIKRFLAIPMHASTDSHKLSAKVS
jgi:hypothetical protein